MSYICTGNSLSKYEHGHREEYHWVVFFILNIETEENLPTEFMNALSGSEPVTEKIEKHKLKQIVLSSVLSFTVKLNFCKVSHSKAIFLVWPFWSIFYSPVIFSDQATNKLSVLWCTTGYFINSLSRILWKLRLKTPQIILQVISCILNMSLWPMAKWLSHCITGSSDSGWDNSWFGKRAEDHALH